jgi:hypothetical protein
MRGGALAEEGVVVAGAACGNWVIDFDDAIEGYEDCVGPKGCMLDFALLEVTESQDGAGENRPELLFLELPLLKRSLVDLIF